MTTLGERIRSWFKGKPAPKETKRIAALQPTWETMQPQYATVGNFVTLVQEGYRKNELIYACVMARAKTAQQIALQVLDTEGEEIDEHPLLDLIHRPNDQMNESDFWAAVTIFQALAGRAVFEIEYANRGLPIALWPLRPDWIFVKQFIDRPSIEYYEYRVPGLQPVMMKPEQVLDFPLFDPLDRFKTYPPVAVAGRVGDVDNAATDLIKLIFENGGMPLGYLKTTQVITDDSIVTEIQNRWVSRYGGWKNWVKPAVLDRDADYQKLTMNLNDEMGFDNLDSRNEARICSVLDVPPILVGAKVGLKHGTYSNYEVARRSWWEDTVLAMYANFLDVIEYKLLPLYGKSNLTIGWDTSKVYAFSANENEAWKRATDAWNANAITLAQFCQECELEEPKGDAGKKYKNEMTTPPQLQPFTQAAAPKSPITGDKPADNATQQDGAQMADQMNTDREVAGIKSITDLLSEIKAIRAELKADVVHNGVMIALKLPPDIAKRVAGYSVNWPDKSEILRADDIHITLAYIGDIPNLTINQFQLRNVIESWLSNQPIINGVINGIGKFSKSHKPGYSAIYANFDSPQLPELRQHLIENLKQANIPYNKEHGFTPHITLAYIPDNTEIPDGNWKLIESIVISSVLLAWGEQRQTFEIKAIRKEMKIVQ